MKIKSMCLLPNKISQPGFTACVRLHALAFINTGSTDASRSRQKGAFGTKNPLAAAVLRGK